MSASLSLAYAVYGKAGYNCRPSWCTPWRMARSNAIVPKGVSNASPPALALPPGAVWQATQSPAAATRRPRSMARIDYSDTSGPAVSGSAGCIGHSAAAMPASPAMPAASPTQPRANGLRVRSRRRSASANRNCSESNGTCRRRTPVAS
ncbi:hypothetical protein G6F62_014090 [Rhizopus arrhizus]|nr:hypothetical protein G6F62_014090 [Rhizopus arrhizus]